MTCGIYAIEHRATGLRYIGQSTNIEDRWNAHKRDLNGSTDHSSPRLQSMWDRHGATAFEFRIIERCDHADLVYREQWHIDEAHKTSRLLNAQRTASPNPVIVLSQREQVEAEVAQLRSTWKNFYDRFLALSSSSQGALAQEMAKIDAIRCRLDNDLINWIADKREAEALLADVQGRRPRFQTIESYAEEWHREDEERRKTEAEVEERMRKAVTDAAADAYAFANGETR